MDVAILTYKFVRERKFARAILWNPVNQMNFFDFADFHSYNAHTNVPPSR